MPNAQLAQRILDQITAKPETFNMCFWFDSLDDPTELLASEPVSCGTTMCIAGWACHLEGYDLRSDADGTFAVDPAGVVSGIQTCASALLGISDLSLFHVDDLTAAEALRQIANGDDLSMAAAARTARGDADT